MDITEEVPVCVKAYTYAMNGNITGTLYLHRNHKCCWHSKGTMNMTGWHGELYTTHGNRNTIVFFDFEGRELGGLKWAWHANMTNIHSANGLGNRHSDLGFDGIDYQCRHIHCTWDAHFTSFDGGATLQRMQEPDAVDEWDIVQLADMD